MKKNRLSNKYISEVKKNLKCSSKARKKILDTLAPEIYNFELTYPNATYDDYLNEFNSPKSTAEEYMKELGKNEKIAYLAPRIGAVVVLIIIAFLFLTALFLIQAEGYSGLGSVSNIGEISGSDVPDHYYYDQSSEK